ncbi:MAG: 50S ribosomal protein L7ae [Christensenellaceae bacterium]|jgi:ribosomal protein L7Ae-like RNA K-turn-binding protein|nr:50S ribosomal protein L7ae [Christensenellaceae bacterium]
MNDDKLRGVLGFAMRAGKCLSGDFACERALRGGKVCALLLDAAASANTKDKYVSLCEREKVPCILLEDMGGAIGKEGRMVAAVTDSGFARMLTEADANRNTNFFGGK